jgi:tRNA G18 (ribose-2'-O)-methylase SpoU
MTAVGAEQQASWTYHTNSLDLAQGLKQAGGQLWALEASATAESLFALTALPGSTPVVLVVGNEVTGIDPDLLVCCDRVLAIPMWGIKRSLNVAIAFGIAVYWLRMVKESGRQLPL